MKLIGKLTNRDGYLCFRHAARVWSAPVVAINLWRIGEASEAFEGVEAIADGGVVEALIPYFCHRWPLAAVTHGLST